MTEKSKSSTRAQIDGILEFLGRQLTNQTLELKKYQTYSKLSWTKVAVQAVKDNITNTIKTIEYYKSLKAEYSKKGLI